MDFKPGNLVRPNESWLNTIWTAGVADQCRESIFEIIMIENIGSLERPYATVSIIISSLSTWKSDETRLFALKNLELILE